MEKTLIILKPDCMERRLCGTVLARFEAAGFDIQASKMTRLTSDQLREHYAHVADKPFYPEIEAFMSSRPVIVAVLVGENVISPRPRTPRTDQFQSGPQGHHPWRFRHRDDAQCLPRLRQPRRRGRRGPTFLPS